LNIKMAAGPPPVAEPTGDFVYPKGLKLALLMLSIFLGIFLVALVRYHLQSHC
jgi:hypothetical protein